MAYPYRGPHCLTWIKPRPSRVEIHESPWANFSVESRLTPTLAFHLACSRTIELRRPTGMKRSIGVMPDSDHNRCTSRLLRLFNQDRHETHQQSVYKSFISTCIDSGIGFVVLIDLRTSFSLQNFDDRGAHCTRRCQ